MKTNETTTEAVVNKIAIPETGLYAEASCGKVKALVCIHDNHVRVICCNASHSAWRGMGRVFPSIAEAIAGYKSQEMKSIIAAVDRRNR